MKSLQWFATLIAWLLTPFAKLKRHRRGTALALVVGLISIGIILIVGLYVTGKFFEVADALNLGTAGNATRSSLKINIYSGYDLAVILPIIGAASAILGSVVYGFLKTR